MSMSRKLLLRPDRHRRIPKRFSWVDQRLVRDGHLRALSTPWAAALYLFLDVVGDAAGISWYSQRRIGFELGCSQDDLEGARRELIAQDLIAWDDGVYQVLELPFPPSSRRIQPQCEAVSPAPEANGCEPPATPEQVHAMIGEFKRRCSGA